jgi:hypothetical protein
MRQQPETINKVTFETTLEEICQATVKVLPPVVD